MTKLFTLIGITTVPIYFYLSSGLHVLTTPHVEASLGRRASSDASVAVQPRGDPVEEADVGSTAAALAEDDAGLGFEVTALGLMQRALSVAPRSPSADVTASPAVVAPRRGNASVSAQFGDAEGDTTPRALLRPRERLTQPRGRPPGQKALAAPSETIHAATVADVVSAEQQKSDGRLAAVATDALRAGRLAVVSADELRAVPAPLLEPVSGALADQGENEEAALISSARPPALPEAQLPPAADVARSVAVEGSRGSEGAAVAVVGDPFAFAADGASGLAALVGIAAMLVVLVCGGLWLFQSEESTSCFRQESATLAFVEAWPLSKGADLAKQMPAAPLDCNHVLPWTSGQPVRLKARVVGPSRAGARPLETPLTQRPCVLYSSGASRSTHDGMHPVSVAFSRASVDFIVSLVDAPHMLIEVRGDDVLLCAMREGRRSETTSLQRAPEHWRTFVRTQRSLLPTDDVMPAAVDEDVAPMEFQECSLLIGARCTLVGELQRQAGGGLALLPLRGFGAGFTAAEGASARGGGAEWRTSWETLGSQRDEPRKGLPPDLDKVIVSDHPRLLARNVFG